MVDIDKKKSHILRCLVLTASLGGLAVAGCSSTDPAARETVISGGSHCSAAVRSNSASAVNSVLRSTPSDPCIPAMLSALPSKVLAKVNPRLVDRLPAAQRKAIPRRVLAQIGRPTSASATAGETSMKQGRQY